MNWIFISLITALGFGLADTFTKIASDKISAVSGVVFLHLTSGMIALCVFLALPLLGFEKQNITQSGALYTILAGVFTFIAVSSFFLMFSKGAPLGLGVTVTFITSITITLLISVIFLKETLSLQQGLGVCTALLSIYLLAPKT